MYHTRALACTRSIGIILKQLGFYLIILFSKNIFWYAICLDSFKIPYFVAPDLGPFVLEK